MKKIDLATVEKSVMELLAREAVKRYIANKKAIELIKEYQLSDLNAATMWMTELGITSVKDTDGKEWVIVREKGIPMCLRLKR